MKEKNLKNIIEIIAIIPDNVKSAKMLIDDISSKGLELFCVVSLNLVIHQQATFTLAVSEPTRKLEDLARYNFEVFKKSMKDLRQEPVYLV